jgi:serum/glucocorticoid-regulated kinase 2
LHNKNILYRDLKPENILVDEKGHLKLTDFGLCKLDFKKDDLTASFVGSPEYMSPEILNGQLYNYSVDFYTLGVLFYEMVVGLPPHYSENKLQMYNDIKTKTVRIPYALGEHLRDLLERLLKINPKERMGSVNGM